MSDDQFEFWTRARSTDPHTSFDAAEKISPKVNRIQAKVLMYYRSIFPNWITDYELQQHFGNDLSTYRTRRSELTHMGLVEDTKVRKFQAGSDRICWRATPWPGCPPYE